ncbi:hypothetical protein FOA52_001232 [Chlamydomonas sp. UWO 241]|nr:hypothetical protein FOA52_001232 [Chlamydomonas sp. UWO 241]
MPTEVKFQLLLPGSTPKDYFRVVYSDDKCLRAFHAEVNKDPGASVTAWDGGRRSVSFRMPINVPAFVKSFIGADSIKVTEQVACTWSGQDSFELISQPVLDFPGANKFTTGGTTLVTPTPDGCCVDVVMTVMVTEGRTVCNKFLEFTRIACEDDANYRASAATAAAAASAAAAAAAAQRRAARAAAGCDDEDFWDAREEEGNEGEEDEEPRRAAAAPGAHGAPGQELSVESVSGGEAALRCLVQIHASCSESAGTLREVADALRSINAAIADIRAAVVPKRSGQRVAETVAAAARAAGSGGGAPSGGGAGGYSWTAMMCMGLAGASLASIVYMRATARSRRAAGGGGAGEASASGRLLYDLLGPLLWGAMTGLPARAPTANGMTLPELQTYTAAALTASAAEQAHAAGGSR